MAYARMNEEEIWAFLTASPARPAVLATTKSDGRPHAAPVWYAVDRQTLVLTTGADTVKGRTLRRDPRVALCVDDDAPPFSFAAVEGEADISDDLAEVRRWATIIGGRYMGAEQAERFGERNGVPGELLVRVRPSHITAFRDLAD
jgi:PPOX class probable F420-dependent enzyme